MAVTIDTYYSEKIVEGAKPSIPDTPETEIPPVLNPPGAGNTTTYKQLGDTTDKSFVGKEGYVPVVVGDVLTLVPMPNSLEGGLITPGVVQWTGTGYVFNVSGAIYRIAGTPYSSDADQVTLATPDATFDRIDVFAVDNTGSVVVLTGTPSSSPVKPQINPTTQVELTSVIVTAASSTPTLTEEVIYDENVEWTGTSSGTGTANFSSATNPFQGSVSVETTNIQNGFYVQFDNGSTIDISDYQTLGFQLDLKSSMGSGQNIFISFLDGSGVAASTTRQLSFDKSSTDYQFVGLVLSSISFTTTSIRYVRFSFVRYSGPVTHAGYFFDILKLEGGINPPVTIGSFLGLSDTPSSYLGQAGKVVSVTADETRLEFTTPGGGGATDTDAVHYSSADGKTPTEMQQARDNIGSSAGKPQIVTSDTDFFSINPRASNFIVFTGGTVGRSLGRVEEGVDGEIVSLENRRIYDVNIADQVFVFGADDQQKFNLGGNNFLIKPGQRCFISYNATLSRWIMSDSMSQIAIRKDIKDTAENGLLVEGIGNTSLTIAPLQVTQIGSTSPFASVQSWFNYLGVMVGAFMQGGRLYLTSRSGTASLYALTALRRDEQRLHYSANVTTAGAINNQALTAGIFNYRFTLATTISGFANGEIGITIDIDNATGATLTIQHENAGSTAANRIKLIGAADIVMPIDGKMTIRYCTGSRWELISKNF